MHEFYFAEEKRIVGDPLIPTNRSVVEQVVPQIKEPCHNIFEQMHELIARGEYGVIMREGMSSKIPTYVIGRAIGDIYKELGYPYPFFETSSPYARYASKEPHEVTRRVADVLQKRGRNERVLVVTDMLANGSHILNYKDLGRAGIRYDVASLSTRDATETYIPMLAEGSRLFVGSENGRTLLVSKRPQLNGRYTHEDVSPRSVYKLSRVNPVFGDIPLREIVQTVWTQAKTLRESLVRNYFQA